MQVISSVTYETEEVLEPIEAIVPLRPIYNFQDVARAIALYEGAIHTCLPKKKISELPNVSFEEALAFCRIYYPDFSAFHWMLSSTRKAHIADVAGRWGLRIGVRYLLTELGFKFDKKVKTHSLSHDNVREIRKLADNGTASVEQLMERFKVSKRSILKIIKRETYKNVS